MALGLWTRLQSIFFGGAIGAAASKAIEPALEPAKQHAWQKNPVRVLDVGTLGELAAKGLAEPGTLADEASRTGYDLNRLEAEMALAQSFPDGGELRELERRKFLGPDLIEKALSRHGLPAEYHAAVRKLVAELLSVADVAAGIQQGHLPNPGILPDVSAAVSPAQGAVTPVAPDQQPPSSVPLTQVGLDPVAEASAAGVDVERLRVMANLAGLPPGAVDLLQMWNRGLIDEASVDAGIREGHLKTKWAGAFKRYRWAVLGAAEYAGLRLRGWITAQESYVGGALTGHTKDQMDLLYLNRGRPLAPVQAFVAWARGAPHPQGLGYTDRPGTFDEQDFTKAIEQSDVRTEYAPILWHDRFAYPSLFQLGRLAQAGALPRARTETILKYERYEPEDIAALLDFWYGKGPGKPDPHVALAERQAIAAAHKSFIGAQIDENTAAAAIAPFVTDAAVREQVLAAWVKEKAVTRIPLTALQIKKAYADNIFTLEAATLLLEERGYKPSDADVLLKE